MSNASQESERTSYSPREWDEVDWDPQDEPMGLLQDPEFGEPDLGPPETTPRVSNEEFEYVPPEMVEYKARRVAGWCTGDPNRWKEFARVTRTIIECGGYGEIEELRKTVDQVLSEGKMTVYP